VIALDIVIILFLIGINGLLAMSELAVVSSRTHRLSQRAEDGHSGARIALELSQHPTRFLSTIQIGITLVAIVSGAFGGATFGSHIAPVLEGLGLSESSASSGGVIIAIAAITYLSIVFGEIVPKRIAINSPEAVASVVSRPMRLLSRLGAPFVALLTVSTAFVLRLIGLHREREESMTDEEIRLMIGLSAQSGGVDENEAVLLDRVFHFGDQQVHEVMTPRNLAVGVDKNSTIGDFYTVYNQAPHSRFPAYDDNLDSVVGILGIKDVLGALARGEAGPANAVEPLIREAMFIPESKPIDDLFREMQAAGAQMAVVVDEFGGTAGIVTLEQLLEEMVGQVRDELAADHGEIVTLGAGEYEIHGALSIDEARSELALDIPVGPYDTVAGYVLHVLKHIPSVGESVAVGHHRITVLEMRNVRIQLLRVTRSTVAAGSA
jgi:putative hemolysin